MIAVFEFRDFDWKLTPYTATLFALEQGATNFGRRSSFRSLLLIWLSRLTVGQAVKRIFRKISTFSGIGLIRFTGWHRMMPRFGIGSDWSFVTSSAASQPTQAVLTMPDGESLMSELGSDLKLNIQELLDREDLPNETTWGAEWSEAVRQRAIAEAFSSAKSATTTKNSPHDSHLVSS